MFNVTVIAKIGDLWVKNHLVFVDFSELCIVFLLPEGSGPRYFLEWAIPTPPFLHTPLEK